MAFAWPWSKQFSVLCPDGTTQYVFRNIDHAFPFYFKQAKTSAAAALEGLEKIKGKLDAKHQSEIKHILFSIDEKNGSIQAHLRAAYVIYASAPCKKLEYLQSAIEEIRADERDMRSAELAIRQLVALLAKNTEDSKVFTEVSAQLLQIVAALNRHSPATILAEKMKLIAAETEEWRRQ